MTRLTIDDLTGDMPEQMLIAALDDDRDGFADRKAFDAALASANARAGAIFGGPIPAQYSVAVDYAVRVFLLDLLYRRHGDDDGKNPWAKLAAEQEARLRAGTTLPEEAGKHSWRQIRRSAPVSVMTKLPP